MIRARRLAWLGALAIGASGCADPPSALTRPGRPDDTLVINSGAEPSSLDPARGADNVSLSFIHAMFEGLTTYGPQDLRPVQGVARAYARSDDGLRYRFDLRFRQLPFIP